MITQISDIYQQHTTTTYVTKPPPGQKTLKRLEQNEISEKDAKDETLITLPSDQNKPPSNLIVQSFAAS